jgi:hypothetical protein
MASFLRISALIIVLSTLLVIASIVIGRMSPSIILVNSQEIGGQLYLRYVEDQTRAIRINIAGTRCPISIPTWVYPNDDSVPSSSTYYSRSFLKRITDLREVLPLCAPMP